MPMGQLTEEEYAEYEALKKAQSETPPLPQHVTLTPAEMAEYEALRNAQATREEEAAKIAPPDPTHYLHLANGSVVESAGVMTHYKGQLVVNVAPMESGQK